MSEYMVVTGDDDCVGRGMTREQALTAAQERASRTGQSWWVCEASGDGETIKIEPSLAACTCCALAKTDDWYDVEIALDTMAVGDAADAMEHGGSSWTRAAVDALVEQNLISRRMREACEESDVNYSDAVSYYRAEMARLLGV